VLAICCLSLFLVGMDATIINVALPSIGRDFRAPVSGLQWTVDAYMLVVASLLMVSGSVGDRVGRRKVFQIGLVVFTLGSLACSLAPSLGWLVAFRALQAVGGSIPVGDRLDQTPGQVVIAPRSYGIGARRGPSRPGSPVLAVGRCTGSPCRSTGGHSLPPRGPPGGSWRRWARASSCWR
jgi:MFS family permease